jgi:hypothetical protein
MRTRYFEDGGGVGGGADTFPDQPAVDFSQGLAGLGAPQSMLSDNYTPQDNTQRQFYQPVYQPSYTDYNLGNPLAVSQYGQDYVSPFSQGYGQDYGALFGQFVNPFSYSPQFSPQQLYAPQMSYAPDSGFDDYGIAGLSR